MRQGYWQQVVNNRITRRRALAATGAAAMVAGMLSLPGCGGGEGKQTAGSGGTAEDREPPRNGGILNQTIHTDPSPNLDPHQTTTFTTIFPAAPAINQLVQFDHNKPGDTVQDMGPDLAEKWEQPDNLTVVFTLRPDVMWHDGTPLTSEDVKTTLEWLKKPPPGKPSPRSATQNSVEQIEVPDSRTVRVHFSRPTASYLMNLASHFSAIGQTKDLRE